MADLSVTTIVAAAAFAAGTAFGAVAQRTNFCTMGAVSDMVFMEDFRRFRAWLLAIAVAILITQTMHSQGLIDLNKAVYLTPNLGWVWAIIGGLLFGFGMTQAGGCGNKTLVRIGGGNLKSLVVFLVLGIFSLMTMKGLIAIGKKDFEDGLVAVMGTNPTVIKLATPQGMPDMLGAVLGLSDATARWVMTALFVGLFLIYCFKDADFRASGQNIAAGIIIGILVPTGWAITGILGNDDFDPTPLASFTFVGPIGDSLLYLSTGGAIKFGVAAVAGVIFGSFLMSVATKSFHLEAFGDAPDMLRHMFGAALMGIGGVLAMGCTIGQALTGISTLAFSSLLAFISILLGGVIGMKYLEEGSLMGAIKVLPGALKTLIIR